MFVLITMLAITTFCGDFCFVLRDTEKVTVSCEVLLVILRSKRVRRSKRIVKHAGDGGFFRSLA